MNSRFLIMLVIAIVLAGGAALIAKRWVDSQNVKTPVVAEQNTTPVYVAATDIPFAARIDKTHYKLLDWPKNNVPAGAITPADMEADPKILEGKVAQRDFYAGEILLKPQIKEHIGGSTLSALIQEGMRAISVRVNDVVGVAGFILPGNKADIIVASKDGGTTTLLKNINILAIDQIASRDQDKPAVVRALTLEVTPKQAEILVHAMQTGSLQFTLRNPMDSAPEPQTAAAISQLPGQKIKRQKAPLEIGILPWTSQKFEKCKEDGTCGTY